ncbi:6719_t:CDS:2, partial [Funneliformis caledonium]
KEVEDFKYSKRQEYRLYRLALKALSGDQAETSLLNFEISKWINNIKNHFKIKQINSDLYLEVALLLDEKSSEIVKNFWLLIDKECFKHEIENIQLDYTKQGDESNRKKKKKSVSGKERVHYPDTSHTIPLSQQSEFINSGYTTLSSHSLALNCSLVEPLMLVDRINNLFIGKDEVDDILVIDDVDDLCFIGRDLADDYKIEEINVSHLFQKYQNNSINISKAEDMIHQRIILTQQTALDAECEAKFRNTIKTLPFTKIKNDLSEMTLVTNYLDRIMRRMLHDPNRHIIKWSNMGFNKSKARKLEGRAKQPDFVVSVIHQLQICGVIFVGEISPLSEKNNIYKNCKDLIRIGIFMKDCLDIGIGKGADLKVLGFQYISRNTRWISM